MVGDPLRHYRLAKQRHQELIEEGDRQRLVRTAGAPDLARPQQRRPLLTRLGDRMIALGYRLKGEARPTSPPC